MSSQELSFSQGPVATGSQKPTAVPPPSLQQEDSIIHTRITNDEKALRRVTKKFHNYTSVAYDPVVPPSPILTTSVDDARDAFLVELASFHLSLKKSLMVCEAEARQVEEYQREKARIENEHILLRSQIDELKMSLEQAQVQRRRKMEYDLIAEKINALPSREELEQSIRVLENDMHAIHAEHEDQNRVLHAQQAALGVVISNIQDLRLMGKQDVEVAEASRTSSPAPDTQGGEPADVEMETDTREETGEIEDNKEEGSNERDSDDDVPLSKKHLNPSARSFLPHSSSSRLSTPHLEGTPPSTRAYREEGEDDDIEMGELAEEPIEKLIKKKIREEELEEGEASDMSSELSEPPDD
ncbi:hypothetical protein PHLCEN_2v10729 [Hermanssonia centrifuga]|uniref:Uncharacterized protein n=1 Tax=Hermanssonia centrifuga TaxID=98765 RepID=A0A2R6NM14_9APHY|nr:hypothetical protein PHLCEN_2v10729 [Hermanssonia centrifuga]